MTAVRAIAVSAGLFAMLSAPGTIAQERITTVVDNCDDIYPNGGGTSLFQAIPASIKANIPVTFACGNKTTIGTRTRRAGLKITHPVVIDGGGKITLDASNIADTEPLFIAVPGPSVAAGTGFVLKNISIRFGMEKHAGPGGYLSHFGDGNTHPPSVIYAEMDTTLDNVTITDSTRPILVDHHNLTLTKSQITQSRLSAAIETDGILTVQDSVFLSNSGDAAVLGRGQTKVAGSTFMGNSAGLKTYGPLTIEHSLFQSNGEGIQSFGSPSISVDRSVFDHNDRAVYAFLDQGDNPSNWTRSVAFSHTTFKGNGQNKAGVPGGISAVFLVNGHNFAQPGLAPNPFKLDLKYNNFISNLGTAVRAEVDVRFHALLSVTGGTFDYNSGELGGAINWAGGSITVANALFKGNQAQSGSAIYARGLEEGKSSIANTLIVESVSKAGGSAIDLESTSLFNVTIAKNASSGIKFLNPAAGAEITNSVFSDNSGGNCAGVSAATIKGGNLQFGAQDCPGVRVADPALDSFYAPEMGSLAAGSGDVNACRASPVDGYDIIHQSRSDAPTCSSGAFEKQPVRAALNAAKRKDQFKPTQTCANGMIVPKDTPCPAAFRSCSDGSVVPEGGVCPQPPPHRCTNGVVLGGNETCPPVACTHGGTRPDPGTCPNFKCPDGQSVTDNATCPVKQCRRGGTVANGAACPMLACWDGRLYPSDQECPRRKCKSTPTTVADGETCPAHYCKDESKNEPDGVACYIAPK
jgi:hypothetical protein